MTSTLLSSRSALGVHIDIILIWSVHVEGLHHLGIHTEGGVWPKFMFSSCNPIADSPLRYKMTAPYGNLSEVASHSFAADCCSKFRIPKSSTQERKVIRQTKKTMAELIYMIGSTFKLICSGRNFRVTQDRTAAHSFITKAALDVGRST